MSTSTPPFPAGSDEPDAFSASRPAGDQPRERAVVVGVDASERAQGAVRWAAEEAVRRQAPLLIVHAAPYLGRPGVAGGPPPELARARRIAGHAYTTALHAAPDVRATTEVVPGDPATALLRAGSKGQLIVLGISTTGVADELVLAPTAQKVAASSAQPVVVVPRRKGPDAPGRPVVAILGLGEHDDDEPVATFAADSARRSGLPLMILQTRSRQRMAPGEQVLDDAAWAERLPDVEVHCTNLPGAHASRILGAACPTPLMVLSAGYGTLFHRNMDSLHRWLLRHCTSPMALVPPAHRPAFDAPREEILALG